MKSALQVKIDNLGTTDKVSVVYGESADLFVGWVDSVTSSRLIIEVNGFFTTLQRSNIIELEIK
ncbi:hypothetical protein BTS2_0512 [Bacillus sp. TS-2]|nr:hypothetical protein BTS2_0512 [Bacillus sp. TS-2]